MKRRTEPAESQIENTVGRIVRRTLSRMMNEEESERMDPRLKADIMSDLIETLKASEYARGIESTDGYIDVDGERYGYLIEYEVTERPGWVCTQRAVYGSPENACPAEYRLDGDFDFDIKSLCVYDNENDDYVCKDMVPFMTDGEIEQVKDTIDFDVEAIAYDEDEWDAMNEPDYYQEWKDDMMMRESLTGRKVDEMMQDDWHTLERMAFDTFVPFLTMRCGCSDDEAQDIVIDAMADSRGLLPGLMGFVTRAYDGNGTKAKASLLRWAEENAPEELNCIM